MRVFEIIWTDYKSENKYIIGRLIYHKKYIFKYNQRQILKAIESGFRPFIEFPKIDTIYYSNELFETFAIRVPESNNDKIKIILDNNGELATDRITICRRMGFGRK